MVPFLYTVNMVMDFSILLTWTLGVFGDGFEFIWATDPARNFSKRERDRAALSES